MPPSLLPEPCIIAQAVCVHHNKHGTSVSNIVYYSVTVSIQSADAIHTTVALGINLHNEFGSQIICCLNNKQFIAEAPHPWTNRTPAMQPVTPKALPQFSHGLSGIFLTLPPSDKEKEFWALIPNPS